MSKVKMNGLVTLALWIAAIIGIYVEDNRPTTSEGPLKWVTFLIVIATIQLIHFIVAYVKNS